MSAAQTAAKPSTVKRPCPVGKPTFTLTMWPCAERKA